MQLQTLGCFCAQPSPSAQPVRHAHHAQKQAWLQVAAITLLFQQVGALLVTAAAHTAQEYTIYKPRWHSLRGTEHPQADWAGPGVSNIPEELTYPGLAN